MADGIETTLKLNTSPFDQSIEEAMGKVVKFGDMTEANSQQQSQSWGRVQKAIGGVAIASAGLFKSMVEASPSLSAAFAEMNFMFEEMMLVLGEALAPIIEDVLVPAVEKLTDFIIDLSPEVQAIIAGAIGLIAAFTTASSIATLFGGSLTALLGPVGLVIAGIALLGLAYTTNFGGIKDTLDETFASIGEGLTDFYESHKEQFDRIGELMSNFWDIIKPFVEAIVGLFGDIFAGGLTTAFDLVLLSVDFLLDAFEGFMEIITGLLSGDWELVMDGFVTIIEGAIDFLVAIFTDFGDFLGDLFEDLFGVEVSVVFEAITESITAMLNGLIGFLNDFLIVPLNDVLDSIADIIDFLNGKDKGKPDLSLSLIPTFHDGGIVPGAQGEEVLVRALAGEIITNPTKGQSVTNFTNSNPMNINNKIVINNPQLPDRRSQQSMANEIDRVLRRNQSRYISGR